MTAPHKRSSRVSRNSTRGSARRCVDLGILDRRSGNLDAAAHALQQAVARDPHSALAWTELGVTQRLGGRFQDAEQSYARAIAADPTYAPAYRDRGVLRDLYLDQPAAALGDFEQYRKLAGQDKPVVMWIAELQHRTGIKEPPGSERPATAAGVSAQSPAPATAAAAAAASGEELTCARQYRSCIGALLAIAPHAQAQSVDDASGSRATASARPRTRQRRLTRRSTHTSSDAARVAAASHASAPASIPAGVALGASDITGNKELPKVMVIVPWKDSLGAGGVIKPTDSLMDDVLQPVDRGVFQRQIRYYGQLDAPRPRRRAGWRQLATATDVTRQANLTSSSS